MNHTYRLVWSRVLRSWVAAAETARGSSKGSGRRLAATAIALSAAAAAHAAPVGGQIVSGSGHIGSSGNTTTITQSSQKLSLNWRSFNVGSQETVNFVQPSASAIAVNRIFSTSGTTILGHLNANGQVYLINPNGILFGAGAQVNVGGLVASTLGLNDASLSGNSRTFSGSGTGSVINLGTITAANGGYVALLGNTVSNQGTIAARLGSVSLGAGSAVTLNFGGDSLVGIQVDRSTLNNLAANGGLIEANGGTVVMTAGAKDAVLASVVNNTGVIEARTVENHDGKITLLGGMTAGQTNVGGTLDASAPDGGNGGAIETSAATVNVAKGTVIETQAPQGLMGSWLIDPTDFTVAASGGNISGAALSAELGLTNITIDTVHTTGSGAGDIDVDDAVNWSSSSVNASSNTLTLNAANNINISAPVSWGVSGTPGDATTTGALVLNAGGVINIGAAMNAYWRAPLTMNTEPASYSGVINTLNVNLVPNAGGFSGAVNFYADAGATAAGGTGLLTINGNNYTVISDVTPGSGVGVAGDTSDPNATDSLQGIQNNLGGYYALGSNIDASATASWNGGAGFTPISIFTGIFDGLGHTITGLSGFVTRSAVSTGMFGTSYGTVRNVGIVNARVSAYGGSYVGTLVGMNRGSISNSFATGTASGGASTGGLVGGNAGVIDNTYANVDIPVGSAFGGNYYGIGGLVGSNFHIIRNSYALGDVHSVGNAGGLVGSNWAGSISDSYAGGTVWSRSGSGGGLVGYGSASSIDNSYATGDVTGAGWVGGLIGFNLYSASISNSYATGNVSSLISASADIGGLAGVNGGPISNSYATGTVTGTVTGTSLLRATTGGLVGLNNGTIENSYATGNVSASGSSAGGLLGANYGTIENSYATGNVSATGSQAGGLVGYNNGTIENSYATGIVSASGSYAGGLVGFNGDTIENSYATGSVSAAGYAGGLVGGNYGTIENSYATGSVSASEFSAGGLAGVNGGTIENSYATGSVSASGSYAGGLVGVNTPSGTIENSYATGSVSAGSYAGYEGGLVGNNYGTIENSYATGTVSAGYYAGGLVGANTGIIENSYATGNVSASGSYAGGLAGGNYGTIENSYATGSVSASGSYAGGLVGFNGDTIENSYATGSVSAAGYAGGLVGYNDGTIANSFWNTQTSGLASPVGSGTSGGTGLTTAQMQDQSNFTSATAANGNVNPGWDFSGTWVMSSGANPQPVLRSLLTTVTVTAGNVTTTYNGQGYSGNGGATFSVPAGSLQGTLTYGGTAQGAVNAGTYTITLGGLSSLNPEFVISYVSGELTIDPATLTVTASAAGSTYGSTPSGLTGTVTGFVNGQTLATATTGTESFTTPATATSNVGSYAVDGSGLTADNGNYVFVQAAGNVSALTVNPATLTVTGTTVADKVYDGTTSATLTVGSLTGVIGNDQVGLTQSGQFTSKNVGNGITVTADDGLSGVDAGNYVIAQPASLTASITPATLTYTAIAATLTAGQSLSGLSGMVSGFVGGDTLASATTGTLAWTTNPGSSVTPGSHAIDGGGLSAVNYVFVQTPGNATALTLKPGSLPSAVTAAAASLQAQVLLPQTGLAFQSLVTSPTIVALPAAQSGTSATTTVAAAPGNPSSSSGASTPTNDPQVIQTFDIGGKGTLRVEDHGVRLPSMQLSKNP